MFKIKEHLTDSLVTIMGTGGSQIINFLFYPVIARVYLPSEFGVYVFALSVISVFGIIACLRFDVVTQICKEAELRSAIHVSFFMILIVTVLTTIGVFIYLFNSSKQVNNFYIIFISLGIFLTGFSNLLSYFTIRKKLYVSNALSLVLKVSVTVFVQSLGYFFSSQKSNLLFLGVLLGLLIQCLYLLYKSNINDQKLSGIDFQQSVMLIKGYRSFLVNDVPAALINAISLNFFILSAGWLYTAKDVGYLGMAVRLVVSPIGIISTGLSKSYMQKLSEIYRNNQSVKKIFVFNITFSLCIGLCAFTLLGILIAPIINLYLGSEWQGALIAIYSLIPLSLVRFVVTNVSTTPLVFQRADIMLKVNILLIITNLVAFFAASVFDLNLQEFILFSSLLSACVYLMFGQKMHKMVCHYEKIHI